MSKPAVFKPNLLALPDAAYLAIANHLGTMQEIWKFQTLHPALKMKLDRLLWSKSRCLMIGTDGRYGATLPTPTFTRQCSRDSGLKSIIRTPGGEISPRPKHRVRFDLENAVWNYATPKVHLLTTRISSNGSTQSPKELQRWPLCTDKPSTSAAFHCFCDYIDDDDHPRETPYIQPCNVFFHGVRKCLRELHVGPVREKRAHKALQKFLTKLTESDVALQKLVVSCENEAEIFQPVERRQSSASDDGMWGKSRAIEFPSRAVNTKMFLLVRANGNSLNSVKVYLDEDFKNFLLMERKTVDDVCTVYAEMVCRNWRDCMYQTLHFYMDALKFETRRMPSRTCIKVASPLATLDSVTMFCLLSGIAFECMDGMRYLGIEIHILEPDDSNNGEPPKKTGRQELLNGISRLMATDDIIPYALVKLETLEWRFPDLEVSTEEFNAVCSPVPPFRNSITIIQIGHHRQMVGAPQLDKAAKF